MYSSYSSRTLISLFVCVCMCVCVCVCAHTHTHARAHTHTDTHLCISDLHVGDVYDITFKTCILKKTRGQKNTATCMYGTCPPVAVAMNIATTALLLCSRAMPQAFLFSQIFFYRRMRVELLSRHLSSYVPSACPLMFFFHRRMRVELLS